MGEVIKFERGCRRCANLVQIDKDSWICGTRTKKDGSTLVIIENGKKGKDWNACKGNHYEFLDTTCNQSRSS